MFKRLVLAGLAFAALSAPAVARDLTDLEWEGLQGVVLSHEAAVHAKDAGAVIDVMPPAMLPLIATMTGTTPEVARQQGMEQMMAQAEGASFAAYDIDLDSAAGPYELADGTTYVLLPTKMIELPGDGSVLKDQVTVGILIEGEWYLMGFDDADRAAILIAAYPAFGEAAFLENFGALLTP